MDLTRLDPLAPGSCTDGFALYPDLWPDRSYARLPDIRVSFFVVVVKMRGVHLGRVALHWSRPLRRARSR